MPHWQGEIWAKAWSVTSSSQFFSTALHRIIYGLVLLLFHVLVSSSIRFSESPQHSAHSRQWVKHPLRWRKKVEMRWKGVSVLSYQLSKIHSTWDHQPGSPHAHQWLPKTHAHLQGHGWGRGDSRRPQLSCVWVPALHTAPELPSDSLQI